MTTVTIWKTYGGMTTIERVPARMCLDAAAFLMLRGFDVIVFGGGRWDGSAST